MKATVPIVSAKIRSDQRGADPRWIELVSVCTLKNSARPITITSACSARSATTSAAIRLVRVVEKPRTLRTAT